MSARTAHANTGCDLIKIGLNYDYSGLLELLQYLYNLSGSSFVTTVLTSACDASGSSELYSSVIKPIFTVGITPLEFSSSVGVWCKNAARLHLEQIKKNMDHFSSRNSSQTRCLDRRSIHGDR